ncbi:glycosyltransferase family 39 protein [Thermomonospora cellulosilytica]|uniref:Mannosyltransferase n=1 Tax=Thermomonospora cellulosilytica TaxID=1411118 RepID=A0A7W3MWP8_9ACTN|nr:glycosyltransferase family 39 protein [Thermomonospora cellulosilytica]MBA9003202.1 mannosyltransferase [Thermomonospora cellulosilytica]
MAGISGPSFWLDEAATLSAARRALPDILRMMGHIDLVHGPYYLMMRAWLLLFGDGEFAMRLPSVLATAAAAAGVAVIGRRLASAPTGMTAGLLYAGHPTAVRYAQEARSYAMVTAVAVLATYLLVRAVDSGDRRWLAGYASALVLLALLNLFGVLLIAAHGATLLWWRGRTGRLLTRWAIAVAVSAVAVVPWALATRRQQWQVAWLPRPNAETLGDLGVWLAGSGPLVVVVLVLAGAGLWAAPAGPRALPLVPLAVPWLLAAPVILLLVSLAEPVFSPRYVLYCLPAVALLMGAGLVRLVARRAVAAIAVAALVMLSIGPHVEIRRQDSRPSDARAAAAVLAAHARPGDGLVFLHPNMRWEAAAYPAAYWGLPDLTLRRGPVRVGNIVGEEMVQPSRVRQRLMRHHRVWVICPPKGMPPLRRWTRVLEDTGPYRVLGAWAYKGGHISLLRREAPADPGDARSRPGRGG